MAFLSGGRPCRFACSSWSHPCPTTPPALPGPAAPGRVWASTVACSPFFRSANTRPSRRPGPGRARRKAGASTRNAKAWKARCPKACGPSACAGRATAAWPRRACSTSRPLRPSISTVLPLGLRADHSRPLASRALLHSRRNRPIRQRCPPVCDMVLDLSLRATIVRKPATASATIRLDAGGLQAFEANSHHLGPPAQEVLGRQPTVYARLFYREHSTPGRRSPAWPCRRATQRWLLWLAGRQTRVRGLPSGASARPTPVAHRQLGPLRRAVKARPDRLAQRISGPKLRDWTTHLLLP